MSSNMKYTSYDFMKREGVHSYIFRTFKHVRKALGPLWIYMTGVTAFGFYVGYKTLSETDIYLNRANKTAPWEWSRAKSAFNKKHKILNDSPESWKEIPELTKIMEEMEVAEKNLK